MMFSNLRIGEYVNNGEIFYDEEGSYRKKCIRASDHCAVVREVDKVPMCSTVTYRDADGLTRMELVEIVEERLGPATPETEKICELQIALEEAEEQLQLFVDVAKAYSEVQRGMRMMIAEEFIE